VTGYYEQKRGLIAVHGKEAVQFLNGLITNDVAKLEDGGQMIAAFPNAQGRLLAVVRVMRRGEKLLFETEETTREKVYNNLFRFTFAGDFFVEDLSAKYRYFELFDEHHDLQQLPPLTRADDFYAFGTAGREAYFIPVSWAESFRQEALVSSYREISADAYEALRIERGIPKYGVDMDETTIVPELGIDGLISYNKGCYIGQEIIARIHFRGHVAKRMTGLVSEPPVAEKDATSIPANTELTTPDGKNAGRITSSTFSSRFGNQIALGYVRFDFLAEGTELKAGEQVVMVKTLPFL
jgi:folate-binding protein YgfZ